jgi:hypothetical protein
VPCQIGKAGIVGGPCASVRTGTIKKSQARQIKISSPSKIDEELALLSMGCMSRNFNHRFDHQPREHNATITGLFWNCCSMPPSLTASTD